MHGHEISANRSKIYTPALSRPHCTQRKSRIWGLREICFCISVFSSRESSSSDSRSWELPMGIAHFENYEYLCLVAASLVAMRVAAGNFLWG